MEEGNTIDFSTGGVCLSSSSSFFIGGGGWGENFFEKMILRLVLPTGWDIPLTLKECMYILLYKLMYDVDKLEFDKLD